jgi:hypothetical protein
MGDMLENEEFFHEQIGCNYSRALGLLKMAGVFGKRQGLPLFFRCEVNA